MLGLDTGVPYRSTVNVQIVNPGSTYLSLSSLQQIGEYYAAKENSFLFYEFLSQELEKYPLETEYTIEDLQYIISAEYDNSNELPAIKVSATADTKEEAAFFAELVPQVFIDYLIAEEKEKRELQYENALEELEVVKAALYEARQKYDELESPDILDNPSYISLKAKVDALQQEFENQLSLLALEYYGTDINSEYEDTLREIESVATELNEAEQELRTISGQGSNGLSSDVDALVLESKVRGLQAYLDFLISGDEVTSGLIQYIANDITSGVAYENLMYKIETTSLSLAEAQQEYDAFLNSNTQQSSSIEQQLAQIRVDTLKAELSALQEKLATLYTYIIDAGEGGDAESKYEAVSLALDEAKKELEELEVQLGYNRLYVDLELEIVTENISNYTDKIDTLTEEIGSLLVDNNIESLETGYLVAGNPSVPSAVIPERPTISNTLIMGAVLGVIIAWITMNFRWILSMLSNPSPAKSEDDEE